MSRHLPDAITRQHILDAIKLLDGGHEHNFGPSTFYDLIYEGRRYPPKAVIGLAAEMVTNDAWYPADFSGGESSRCFWLLRDRGFVVQPKPGHEVLAEQNNRAQREAMEVESLFGHPDGVQVGQHFENRTALAEAGVHGPLRAGIWGRGQHGAQSIVLSGGYEDDEDHGDLIIYTGQGGQENGRQVADQELTRGNAALKQSELTGRPVRVTRGARHKSPFSPASGYRYDGLYIVEDSWEEEGQAGFKVFRFRLTRLREEYQEQPDGHALAESLGGYAPEGNTETERRESRTVRIVRDTGVSAWVKQHYKNQCQVCGQAVETRNGTYSEGAHIQALGRPHNGPDVVGNLLCLCPNHHVAFDKGGFAIADDLSLMGISGQLTTRAGHQLELEYVRYHRRHHGFLDVVAAVIWQEDKLLLARRKPGIRGAGHWELAGGKVEPDEDPRAALERELCEEFGNLSFEVNELAADVCEPNGSRQIRLRAYTVDCQQPIEKSTDHDRLIWVTPYAALATELSNPDVAVIKTLLSQETD